MAIKYIRARPEKDQFTKTAGTKGGSIQQEAVLVYQVEFDPVGAAFAAAQVYNVTEGATAPSSDGGATETLPTLGNLLGATGMSCTKFDVRRTKLGHFLEVYATYSSPPDADKTGKWNVTIESDGIASTENASYYSDGTLITNVNGDIFPDGLSKDFYDEQISVNFKTNAVEASLLSSLRGKVNTAAVTLNINDLTITFPAKTLLLKNSRWKTTYADYTNNKYQFDVSIILLYRNAKKPGTDTVIGWAPMLVSKGVRRFVDGEPVLDDNGNGLDLNNKPITQPIFLDDDGDQLDTTDGPTLAKFYPDDPNMILDTADLLPALTGISTGGSV